MAKIICLEAINDEASVMEYKLRLICVEEPRATLGALCYVNGT